MFATYTQASARALENLRNPSHFAWYLVPILAFVVYVYVVEAERKRWDIFLAGLAFFGFELAWEMFNALVLHLSGRAAMWSAPSDTAYLIFVGLTIEIAMMFSIAGIVFTKALPPDKKKKILHIPNRIFYALAFAVGCVLVETLLNKWGALVWDYAWWRWPNVWLIVLAYFAGFYGISIFHDLKSLKTKAWITIGAYAADMVLVIVFVWTLKWI
ncbi:MAG: hypothetical protein ACYC99_02570 [Candidatus Geothermincolia bacterium]